MDRCHRIGQTRPVLVLRLVTAHSVDGKMLKRAGSKMQLEQLVLKKGTFKDVDKLAASRSTGGFSFEELSQLLESGAAMSSSAQSAEISEEMLEKLLDRRHISDGTEPPFPLQGPGYELTRQVGSAQQGGLGTVRDGA